jgi:hypothetical protein
MLSFLEDKKCTYQIRKKYNKMLTTGDDTQDFSLHKKIHIRLTVKIQAYEKNFIFFATDNPKSFFPRLFQW